MNGVHQRVALLVWAISSVARGEVDTPGGEPGATVVVTATRMPQQVSELVSDITVVTREEIEQAGQSSLVQILQGHPGIQAVSRGGLGADASVFLRGTNSNHVVVLVDGERLASATTGTTAFQHIPPSQIERIEIVRGPMSSLYGADAIGGVIQIFTRSAQGAPRPGAAAGFGSYHTQEYTAGYGGTRDATSFDVNIGYIDSRGFSATRPTNFNFDPDRDAYRNTSLSARLSHRFAPDREIGGTIFRAAGRTHFDEAPVPDPVTDQTLESYAAYLRDQFLPTWRSTLRLGRGVDDTTFRASSTDVFKTAQNQATWENHIDAPIGRVLAGAEYLQQKVSGTTDFPVRTRSIRSLLVGYLGQRDPQSLQVNVRHDDNSQFGGKTTGVIGYGYTLAPGWRASAAYGTAFQAPTFNQLYAPPAFGCPAFGNPDLRPESSRNVEAALRYERGAQAASAVAYRNRIRDLIDAVDTTVPDCVAAANVADAEITGVTLTYGLALTGWTVRITADFLDPENKTTGRVLQQRARHHGALSIARSVGAWLAGVEVIASGPRFNDAANAQRLGGYALVNVFGEYRIDLAWSLFARVNNVFDKDYELVRTFGTAGLNAFLGIRYEAR